MSSDPGTLGPERTTTQLFFLAHCHSEGCTRQRIQPPRPAIPSVPLYRFVDHSFYFILFEEKKISFYKETSVLAIGVRNVQCVGVHESRSRRGEHVNLATSISRHAPNGFFYFFFFKHLDWKNLSFSRCVRDRLNPASLSSLPSTSRATGSKKNFLSFRLNITSEFDIDDAILRNHSLFLKMSLL